MTPDRGDAIRQLKTENYARILIGGMALLLPTALVAIDLFYLPGSPAQRGSISAYYYCGLHDVFVGITCALGGLLIAHRVGERSVDNGLTSIAGIGAMMVALFPTSPPPHLPRASVTAIQRKFGTVLIDRIHLSGAALMLAAMLTLTVVYAVRQGRPPHTGRRSPRFWRWYHLGCTGLMLAAGVYAFLGDGLGVVGPESALLYCESMALVGFSLSWLAVGFNVRALRLPAPAPVDDRVPFEVPPAVPLAETATWR